MLTHLLATGKPQHSPNGSPIIYTNPSNDVLIAIDVQNDFCTGGSLAVTDGEATVSVINRLLARFEHAVFTQDWHPAGHSSFASSYVNREAFGSINLAYGPQTLWPDHCVQGTKGAQFHPDLAVQHSELIIRKGFRTAIDSYSAFFENDRVTPTGLASYLRERGFKRVVLGGLATDFCVAYSALDARAQGFECVLVEDACRAIDLDGSLAHATKQMADAGVQFVSSSDIVRG